VHKQKPAMISDDVEILDLETIFSRIRTAVIKELSIMFISKPCKLITVE
jgi:hypothetical protein